ncbi:MAG: arginase family protein, partial [Lautropia sp.]|nr:arginase family protein [Lautropia sp.]
MPSSTPLSQRASVASYPRKVALIGAPTDVGTSTLGAAMGPDALRVAQLGPALQRLGLEVHDMGNLAGPINPQGRRDPAHGNLRNLTECAIWNKTVFDAINTQFRRGRMPILMGGDHHLSIGSISAA